MAPSADSPSTYVEPQFKHYDRELIREDLEHRVAFARDFLRFTEEDGKVLNSVAPIISPLIKPTVDGVYTQLFRFDVTSIPFLKNNVGFEGHHAESLAQLNHEDPQISYRKKILSSYVGKMFTSDFEAPSTWAYFDKVAAMHTGLAAFKHRTNKNPLVVDLQPMALLLGWIVDVVVKAVLGLPEQTADVATKTAVITAFNKLIWVQNDLFNKYYTKTDAQLAQVTAEAKDANPSA